MWEMNESKWNSVKLERMDAKLAEAEEKNENWQNQKAEPWFRNGFLSESWRWASWLLRTDPIPIELRRWNIEREKKP